MLVSVYSSCVILVTFLKDLGITEMCTGAEIPDTGLCLVCHAWHAPPSLGIITGVVWKMFNTIWK